MPPPRIVWTKPEIKRRRPGDLITEVTKAQLEIATESPILSVLRKTGVPGVQDAKTPKEDAIGLLMLAAEVEHALMIQYLYAAASLKSADAGGVGPWSKIMTVAVQEMGHLLAVQNLLLLVGGPESFHFGRDSIRATSTKNPIPLLLEPVSRLSLAKYIIAEMPAEIEDTALNERVERLRAELNDVSLHRVGAIYAKLFWLFQLNDDPVPPLNLEPNPEMGLEPGWHLKPEDFIDAETLKKFEATRDQWIKGSVIGVILDTAHDDKEARKLISDISEQGEGLGTSHDSHFFEFVELLDLFESGQLTVTPLPTIELPAQQTGTGTTTYARLWAELMDIRYTLLILDLWHAITTSSAEPLRGKLIGLAYTNMSFVDELTKQSLRLISEMSIADATPSYNLLFEDLPADAGLRWKRHKELLDRQTSVIKKITDSIEFQDCSSGECEIFDFEGDICIKNIQQNDIFRRTLDPSLT